MATKTDRRVVEIEVRDKASKQLGKIDKNMRRAQKSSRALEQTIGTLKTVFGALAAAISVQKITGAVDAMSRINTQLKAVTGSGGAAVVVLDDLLAVSNELEVSVRANADLYAKLGRALPTAEHEQLVGSVEAVSRALVVNAADMGTSNAVIRQLAQGLGAGALAGDEFVSILEGAPDLLRAWADAAGETEKGMKQLRDEGFFTTTSFLENLPKITEQLKTLGDVPVTLSGAFQVLSNQFDDLIGKSEAANGAIGLMADAVRLLADNLSLVVDIIALLALAKLVSSLHAVAAGMSIAAAATKGFGVALAFLSGPAGIVLVVGALALLMTRMKGTQQSIEDVRASTEALQASMHQMSGLELEREVVKITKSMTDQVIAIDKIEGGLGKTAHVTRQRLEELRKQLNVATGALGRHNASLEKTGKSTGAATVAVGKYAKAAGGGSGGAAKATEDWVKTLEQVRDEMDPIAKLTRETAEQVLDLKDAFLAGALGADEMQRAVAFLNDRLQEDIAVQTQAGSKAQETADLYAQAWKDAAGRIQDSMAGAFKDLFTGSLNKAGDFLKSLKDIVIDSVAELAAQLASQKLVVPIIAAVGGAFGVEQAAAGVTGQLVGQTGNALGLSGLLSPVTNAIGSIPKLIGLGVGNALEAFGLSTGIATGWGAALASAIPIIGAIGAGLSLFGGGLFGDKTKPRAQSIMTPWADPAGARMFEDGVFEVAEKAGWTFGLGGKSHGVDAEEWRDTLRFFADAADVIAGFLGPDVISEIDARIEKIDDQMKGIGLAIDTGDAEAAFDHFFSQIAQFAGETGTDVGEQFARVWEIAGGDIEAVSSLMGVLTAQAEALEKVLDAAGPDAAAKLSDEFNAAFDAIDASVDSVSNAGQTLVAALNAILAFDEQVSPEIISKTLTTMLETYEHFSDSAEDFGTILGVIVGSLEALSKVDHLLVDAASAVDFLDREFQRMEGDIEKFAAALDSAVAGMLKLEEFVNADIVTDFTDAWRDQNETMWEGIKRLDDHIQGFNWSLAQSLDDIAKAGDMVEERYRLELELLSFIDGALRNIKTTAEAAREQILLTNATDQQQYEYFRRQSSYFASLLEQTNDPELVAKYGGEAIEAALKAWGKLPPDLQAQNQLDFIKFIDYIEASVTAKLEDAAQTSLSQLEISQQQVASLLGLEETNRQIATGLTELLGYTKELIEIQRVNEVHNDATSHNVTEQTRLDQERNGTLTEISGFLRRQGYGS